MVLLLAGCIINAEVYERRKAELTDADGDGFAMEDECDDDDATIFPGADESCDGVDQDCDGEVDEGASDAATWHPDEDGDGYGEAGGAVVRCDSPGRAFSNTADDCDDADPYSYPGATEVEYDGVDQDCSGADLDDLDGDGYANADDCDEGDAAVHPGAAERWANAFADDDCDGALDQDEPLLFGDTLWYSTVADAALGTRVRGYVDVDGDGAAEVLTTAVATTRTHSRSGAVYLLSPSGSGDVDAGALRTIDAGGSNWYLGVATDTRDLDGDGLPEVLASASGVDTTGAGYLVAGASLHLVGRRAARELTRLARRDRRGDLGYFGAVYAVAGWPWLPGGARRRRARCVGVRWLRRRPRGRRGRIGGGGRDARIGDQPGGLARVPPGWKAARA